MSVMETKTLVVRKNWIKLENTQQGCLLQHIDGVTVYYYYSAAVPPADGPGHVEDSSNGPLPLLGGDIWVRSENYAVVAYTPYNVDANTLSYIVGRLEDLDTDAKDKLVNAINELVAVKANLSMVMDIKAQLDDLADNTYEDFDIEITPTMIADRFLTLDFVPKQSTFKLTPHGGIMQKRNSDYYINGNQVHWENLGLEVFLTPQTVINITCVRS